MNTSKNKEYTKLLFDLRSEMMHGPDRQNYIVNKTYDFEAIDEAVYKKMVCLFHDRHKRYPTAIDFTHENLLPYSRHIQRKYGGLKKFRESMNLTTTDYSSGKTRSEQARRLNIRAKKYEQELFLLIYKKFHNTNKNIIVNREPLISGHNPDTNSFGYRHADVSITDFSKTPNNIHYIDFFYATSPHSLFGCVNIKNKKIKGLVPLEDIVYVSVNPDFTTEDISKMKLPKNSPRVLSYEEFITEYLSHQTA